MRLTAATDFAFRVLLYLTLHHDRVVPTGEIGKAYGVSVHHLGKIVHRLGRGGWVEVKRGRGGGLRLGRPAAEIRLHEVLAEFEPDLCLAECFDVEGNTCPIASACGVSPFLHLALRAFLERLSEFTLADAATGGRAAYQDLFHRTA